MKRRSVVLMAVLGLAIVLSGAVAADDPPPQAKVTWNSGSPAAAAGTINGSGAFDVPTGWTITGAQVAMVITPVDGGTAITVLGAIAAGPPKTWGPATATGLAKGKYNVQAQVGTRDPNNQPQTSTSTVVQLDIK